MESPVRHYMDPITNLHRDLSLNIDRRRGDLSHEWILKCFFELPSCEKAFGHWSQEYGFSPEFILICVLKFCHLKMILSIDCKGMVYPLNEFSNVSSNFHFMRKLLGIDFMGMVFPQNEFSNDFSNFHLLKKLLCIDYKDMVYPLNEFSNASSNFRFV